MGMFDSVIFECPKCGHQLEAQSKEGDCVLARYSRLDVPPDIAKDIANDGHVYCDICENSFAVELEKEVKVIYRLRLV